MDDRMDSLDEACEDKAVARTAWVKVREDETCNNEARDNEVRGRRQRE